MQGFEEILIELLLRHNCVVVPGFGGFVAKQISAQIDFEKGLVNPPKKELLFNRFLLTDDGLFLAEYSRRNGLFYEEAKNKLQVFTDQLLLALRTGEPVKIPKIGTFVRQQDGQIRFDQDRFFNLLLSSYGLGNLSFVAKELAEKRLVSGNWSWLVPPMSGSATEVFHHGWKDRKCLPDYQLQPNAWTS